VSDPISGLLAGGADHVAARVFADVFTPDAPSPQPFREVRARLSALAGATERRRFLTTSTMAEPAFAGGLEVVLLWERALLAARNSSGDQGLFIVVLREGEAARASGDVYATALSRLLASRGR
jgi:hypothetical protein